MNEITSIIKIFMEPGITKGSSARTAIRPGALLTGRITQVFPSGLLQIDFGKFRSQTRVKFPVAKGDTLRFEVLEAGDQIKLKIQDPPPIPPRSPAGRSFKPEDIQQFRQAIEAVLQKTDSLFLDRELPERTRLLLASLGRHLLPLSPEKETSQIAALIKANLGNSGIFFEKNLETTLLRIFKTPEKIDVGRAVAHPFISNILDSDLKPNLLKLAVALVRPGVTRDLPLDVIRKSVVDMLKQIQSEQAKLTRFSPAGSGKRPFTYNRANRALSGLQKVWAPNPPDGAIKEIPVRLSKSGLWSDPEIRSGARILENLNPRRVTPGRLAFTSPGQVRKTGIQKMLANLIKSGTALQSKTIKPFLKTFQIYVRENRFTLDHKTETALSHIEKAVRATPAANQHPGCT